MRASSSTGIVAVLRRAAPNGEGERIDFEGLALDQASHRVLVGAQTVPLGPTEYRMLEFFMTHPERVYTRDQLLDATAGRDWQPFDRSIDVHVSNLRRKLDSDPDQPSLIRTVRGTGYSFEAQ